MLPKTPPTLSDFQGRVTNWETSVHHMSIRRKLIFKTDYQDSLKSETRNTCSLSAAQSRPKKSMGLEPRSYNSTYFLQQSLRQP